MKDDLMTSGAFARTAGLSPKAARLVPADVRYAEPS